MSTTGAATPGSSSGKAPRILACVLCQHRKIKCDRNFPCANCLKANVTCTPSTPAPARKRRRPNQDLQERLARCEELLKSYATAAGNDSPSSGFPHTPHSSGRDLSSINDARPEWAKVGKVVVEDGSTRFLDNWVWTTIHDELTEMRRIVETEEPDEQSSSLPSEAPTPDEAGDLLLGVPSRLTSDETYPEPVHVFRLWQIFLERVNPLCKVIHVPSVQPYVVEVASGNWDIPLNYQPLLFAIFTMAVFSLKEEECRQMLGVSREAALQRFTAGQRNALIQVNFMKTYDLCILQSLALYLLSLQGRQNRHASWVLSGVCIRIAQKMGLHRDGEALNLTPFETEMRRRLWWQLVVQDASSALLSGLSYPVMSVSWDTKFPQNLNDADLFPGSSEPIQEREGPTEMGFSILLYAVWRFIIRCHQDYPAFEAAILGYDVSESRSKEAKAAREGMRNAEARARYLERVAELEEELREIQEKYLDPGAGAANYVAWHMPDMMLSKMRDCLVPYDETKEGDMTTVRDNLFRLGVASLEQNEEMYAMMEARGFFWHCKLHFQVEFLSALVGGQLIQKPLGPLPDRAWKAIDVMYRYHADMYDMTQRENVTLRAFVLKAWKARVAALAARGSAPEEAPVCVQELTRNLPEGRSESATPASTVGSVVGGVVGAWVKPADVKVEGPTSRTPAQASVSAPTPASVSASMQSPPQPLPAQFQPLAPPGQQPLPGQGVADVAGFGGMVDLGAMDWEMFADSMGHEQTHGEYGFGMGGLNLGPPW